MKKEIIFGLVVLSLVLIACAPKDKPVIDDTSPVIDGVSSDTKTPADKKPVEVEVPPAIIEIKDTVPKPMDVVVKVGQTILWRNNDQISYRVVGDKTEPFKSDPVAPGYQYVRGYTVPGNYTYYLIPGKAGRIEVIG